MSSRSHERRTDRATAEEVAEIERQLWEFAKRIDPPGVPEARLRPGAFLWRVHRTWHSLGRGKGGLEARSFRALREELLRRDPPVRNLQPKLYGNTALSDAEAEQLIDVMLETWHLESGRNGKWHSRHLLQKDSKEAAGSRDLQAIRENLLHTLFKGDDQLYLEEPVGVAPEIFVEERGQQSIAYIIPTKGETVAHFSPSNAYGGFSSLNGKFIDAAIERRSAGKSIPLLIWVLRLDLIRDNAEFHQSFHSLAVHSACLTNWFFRLSQHRNPKGDQDRWEVITNYCAFAIHGLPSWATRSVHESSQSKFKEIDKDLYDLGPDFMVPYRLPIVLGNHRQVKRHKSHDFALAVSLEPEADSLQPAGGRLNYWLFPDQPSEDLQETAETTGLPVFNAEMSPGPDFDLAYTAIYEAVAYRLGISEDKRSLLSLHTLRAMGWSILTIEEFQACLAVSPTLPKATQ